MEDQNRERPAFLIIDMLKDNFEKNKGLPITPLAKQIISPINSVINIFRRESWPIVFSTDAFKKEDFIFKGHMKPHSLAGSEGAKVIDKLDFKKEDLWLPKPRFSAFFKTGVDLWLRKKEVTLCAVAGIATNFCALTTALVAICYNFKTVLIEDCTAASSESIHHKILDIYRRNPLYPLLRIATSADLLKELTRKK